MSDILDSIQAVKESLDKSKRLVEIFKKNCEELELKLSTLMAANKIVEAEGRSKSYNGLTFKSIVMKEVERFGIKYDDFVKLFKEPIASEVGNCIIYGTPPREEYHAEIAKRTSDEFELNFSMLLDSLKREKDEGEEEFEDPGSELLIPKDFGGMLRFYLKRCGLSQKDLAIKIGASQGLVSFWCLNKVLPRDSSLKKLSSEFNIDIKDWKEAIRVSKNNKKS